MQKISRLIETVLAYEEELWYLELVNTDMSRLTTGIHSEK